MAKFILYTNYLSDKDKETIKVHLAQGDSVCVDSTCIGHTRAQMVRTSGELFMESLGATLVDKELIHVNNFYALTTKEENKQ